MPTLDFAAVDRAIEAAEQLEDLKAPLADIAAMADMENYAALRLRGRSNERLVQIMHSAPLTHVSQCEDASYWQGSEVVQRLLKGPPVIYSAHDSWAPPSDVPGFEHGVSAMVHERRGACLLFLGRSSGPIAPADQMDCIRVALLASTRLAQAFVRLHMKICPLSERQIDCLRYALMGHTAVETAQALNIGARTVEQYLTRARAHLQANNTLAAAMRAIDEGWLDISEITAQVGT